MIRFEWKKLVSMPAVFCIFIALLVAGLLLNWVSLHNQIRSGGVAEKQFQEYMERLEGPLTPEKEQFLDKEKQRIDEALSNKEEMQEKYERDEISKEEFAAFNENCFYAQQHKDPFQRVWDRYQMIKESPNSAWFVYDTCWSHYFLNGITGMALTLGIFFLFSAFVGNEFLSGMWQYLASSKNGRNVSAAAKLELGLLVAFAFSTLLFAFRLLLYYCAFSLPAWDAPLQSLTPFFGVTKTLTVGEFLWLSLLCQIIMALALAVWTIALGWLMKGGASPLFLLAGLYVVPMVIKGYATQLYAFCIPGAVHGAEVVSMLSGNSPPILFLQIFYLAAGVLVYVFCILRREKNR